MVLAKLLPTPIRSFVHEAKMPLQANLSDVFSVIPVSLLVSTTEGRSGSSDQVFFTHLSS
jgi:hypothetical protein